MDETLPPVAEGFQRVFMDVRAESLPALVEAVCATYGYRTEIPDPSPENRKARAMIANPQSPGDFLKAHVAGHLQQILSDYQKQQALKQLAIPETQPLFS